MYIFQSPKNEIQRKYKEGVKIKAECIKAIRIQSIINEEYGFLDKDKLKADFLEYFRNFALSKDSKWWGTYQHFHTFVKSKCSFGELDVD